MAIDSKYMFIPKSLANFLDRERQFALVIDSNALMENFNILNK
jgi:hypothetical protein